MNIDDYITRPVQKVKEITVKIRLSQTELMGRVCLLSIIVYLQGQTAITGGAGRCVAAGSPICAESAISDHEVSAGRPWMSVGQNDTVRLGCRDAKDRLHVEGMVLKMGP